MKRKKVFASFVVAIFLSDGAFAAIRGGNVSLLLARQISRAGPRATAWNGGIHYDSAKLAAEDFLQGYREEARGYPPLSFSQEGKLIKEFRRTRDPQSSAVAHLARHNIQWVLPVVDKYKRYLPGDVEAMMREGLRALVDAIKSYDPEKGKLFNHVMWLVERYLFRMIEDEAVLIKVAPMEVFRDYARDFTPGPELVHRDIFQTLVLGDLRSLQGRGNKGTRRIHLLDWRHSHKIMRIIRERHKISDDEILEIEKSIRLDFIRYVRRNLDDDLSTLHSGDDADRTWNIVIPRG